MNNLNVKDRVDWTIESDSVATRQGKFRSIGEWLYHIDCKIQDKLLEIEIK